MAGSGQNRSFKFAVANVGIRINKLPFSAVFLHEFSHRPDPKLSYGLNVYPGSLGYHFCTFYLPHEVQTVHLSFHPTTDVLCFANIESAVEAEH